MAKKRRKAKKAKKKTAKKAKKSDYFTMQQWCERNEDMIDCAEWVAADLRGALNELGAIFGAVTTDELLNHIFERFCIGK